MMKKKRHNKFALESFYEIMNDGRDIMIYSAAIVHFVFMEKDIQYGFNKAGQKK